MHARQEDCNDFLYCLDVSMVFLLQPCAGAKGWKTSAQDRESTACQAPLVVLLQLTFLTPVREIYNNTARLHMQNSLLKFFCQFIQALALLKLSKQKKTQAVIGLKFRRNKDTSHIIVSGKNRTQICNLSTLPNLLI